MDDHSEGLWNVNGNGIGHEVNNKISCELDADKLNALNCGEMWKQHVDRNLRMLTLLSPYSTHRTRVGRVAGVSMEFAACIFGVAQSDQNASFFEKSATRTSANFEKSNKFSTMAMKFHANLKSVIICCNLIIGYWEFICFITYSHPSPTCCSSHH